MCHAKLSRPKTYENKEDLHLQKFSLVQHFVSQWQIFVLANIAQCALKWA
jgi:hypothetical protein